MNNTSHKTVDRRSFLKLMGAGAAAGLVQPKIIFAQTPPSTGTPINYINVFLYGGADPRFLFPFLEGPVHEEFIRPGGLRTATTYPWSDALEHVTKAAQGRTNPVGWHGSWSSLLSTLSATSCGAALVTEFGVTERESLSHETATKQFQIGLPGPEGDPSSYKQGWLARLIDEARMPALSVWGMGVNDPVFFNSNVNRPLVLSSLDSFAFQNRADPATPFKIGNVQANTADDAVLAREFAKRLASQPHPELPFDAAMTDAVNGIHTTVGLVKSINRTSLISDEYGVSAFGTTIQDVARLVSYTRLSAPEAVRNSSSIICTGIGGWDGHENINYSYPGLIQSVSKALSGLVLHLARNGLLANTVITVMTEFGRTLRNNGVHGLDHGKASYALVLGGKVKNGVIGAEPILSEFQSQSKNSAIAQIPFTSILRPVLSRAGFSASVLDNVFTEKLRNEATTVLPLFVPQ